ncbi:hypothetical protein EYR41_008751 [Orbilia oligospora]|uniref:F-box domain-containing protein n=1 Tax=Orbilia oligospora TaxID=2813651 RepID=A0A8H2DYB0_ORBOL|nr:hypothetical protein EYR41_008751 [Orbilia oligospora]
MKILSFPTEILIQIIEHVNWTDHFTLSTVSPVFTSVLQHAPFRRKRYCEEIWDDDEKTDVLDTSFRRFDPDEVRYWPDGPGWRSELGLHGLLTAGVGDAVGWDINDGYIDGFIGGRSTVFEEWGAGL